MPTRGAGYPPAQPWTASDAPGGFGAPPGSPGTPATYPGHPGYPGYPAAAASPWGAPPPPVPPRSRAGWLVAAVAALVVIGVGATAAVLLTGRRTSSPSAPSKPAFTDPGGHFSLAFPVTPISSSQTQTVQGTPITITLWQASVSSTDGYMAGYVAYPQSVDTSSPYTNLAGAVQGAVTGTGGTLVSQSQGTYQGFPSVDALISASNEYVEYRVILDGHSLFEVGVVSADDPPPNFTSFANSLRILAP